MSANIQVSLWKWKQMHFTPKPRSLQNKTLVSHKLLVSEIKTSSQETVSAELTEKVKECFEATKVEY